MEEAIIDTVTAEPLNFDLEEPFEIASGKKPKIENVFVKLTLMSGIEGYGEASPLEPINGENQSTVIAAIRSLSDFLKGKDVTDYEEISERMKSLLWAQASARAAVEMAILDALTKTRGESLWDYYGGAEDTIVTDYTISIVEPDTARKQAKKLSEKGFETLKTKVGKGDEEDLERLNAVSEGAPGCKLNIDANEGFDAEEAVAFTRKLEDLGVKLNLFEQPVKRYDLEGLKKVKEEIDVAVAADEAVFFLSDVRKIVEMRAANVVNIKLMKSGLKEGQEIANLCKENGIDLMVGCMLESMLGMTASVLFASGIGGFKYIDLDPRPEVFTAPFKGGAKLEGNRYKDINGVRPGHGIELE
ncbi:MAG: dipeptide epimerase [Candidatus Bipolaricaulota bacterium]